MVNNSRHEHFTKRNGERMTKRIFKITLLLALAIGFYAMTVNAKGEGMKADPTQTAQPPPATSTARPATCKVITGVDGGTVNLRTCAGTSCGVVTVLTEGQSLGIVKAGLWSKVTTESGLTGWLNSRYCKGK